MTKEREGITENHKSSYQQSLKSMDTEEWWDLHFYRPIGYAWACMARKVGITPNAITIASIFLGVGAGICFYFNDLWLNLLGVLLLVWADSFDSADGQLARMTGKYSRLGRILDGMSSDLWFISIYFAICFRELYTSEFFINHHWVIWILASSAGACHAIQAAMADYYRQFHLYFVKGPDGSELESWDNLFKKYKSLKWSHNTWQKLVLLVYMNYTMGQEGRTPMMQKLRAAIRAKFGSQVPPLEFREKFRKASLPLMKFTNILSFNTRSLVLFISIMLLQMPWIYFVFELTVMNGLLIYMVVRHERICRNFERELTNS